MRHKVSGNHLGRPFNQAKALYRNLVFSLVERGQIQTTQAKAKAIVGLVDKVINLAKKNDVTARRQVIKLLGSDQKIAKLFSEVAPKLSDRNSGYTRIVRLAPRFSDTAEMVYLELVNFASVPVTPEPAKLPEKVAGEKAKTVEVKSQNLKVKNSNKKSNVQKVK